MTKNPTTDDMGRCSEHGSAMCTHPTDDPCAGEPCDEFCVVCGDER